MDENKNNEILPAGITEEELEARVNAVLGARTGEIKKKQKRRVIGMGITVAIEILIAALLIVTMFSALTGQRFWFFGYFSFSIVATDSMEPEINVDDFIVMKKCGIEEIIVGDNVVFEAGTKFSGGSMTGKSIVHGVVRIENEDGEIRLFTQGKKAGAPPDSGYVTVNSSDKENSLFVGKHIATSAFIGGIYKFFNSFINWIFLIVLIIVAWFGVSQTLRIVKDMKKKKAAAASGGNAENTKPSGDNPENPKPSGDNAESTKPSGDDPGNAKPGSGSGNEPSGGELPKA